MNIFAQLEQIPSTQRLLLFVIILLLVPGGYYYFFFNDNVEQLKKLSSERETLKLTLAKNSAVARRLPSFEQELVQLQRDFKLALAKLPDATEIPELLEHISRLAFARGIQFTLFKPEIEAPKDFYAEIPVSMRMRSDYQSIVRFFEDVGTLARIVNLSNIVITEPRLEDGRAVLRVECVATTYRFLPKPPTSDAKNGKESAAKK
ncbi:MAG: type 4a pilus biogenesis protein PilO [Candidatus Tectomicrobia bacterium]|nr:type 4a pilus biogenesis protein PilO [Candidatus Tectomicrobia bacterium]